MSIVTIVRKGPTCAIAADTLSSFGSTSQDASFKRSESKILRLRENCFGLVGYAAHGLVLASLIERHPDRFVLDDRLSIFHSMLGLHGILKEEYLLETSERSKEQPYESSQMTFCLANASGIYLVDTYREVSEVDRFWAIGSGQSFALGALEALYANEAYEAEDLAREAVRTACRFNAFCGEPIESFSIALAQSEEAGTPAS